MCRYVQSCAFIPVIELPRVPAYCPKMDTNEKTYGDFGGMAVFSDDIGEANIGYFRRSERHSALSIVLNYG